MPCGWEPADCAIEHWCKILGGHREPATWRAPCPLCGATSTHVPLTYWVQGSRIRWKSYCPCERDAIRIKLAELLPGCVAARYTGRHRVESADLIKLADSSMPPQSLRLALYELAGMSTQAALDRLGIRREHRSRVIAGRRLLPHQFWCITAGRAPHQFW